ncbi:MAG TPA: DNA repair exonuclease [Polyangiaceae bacterium]
MKFVHAADLHLDSPLRGLARYEGAPLQAIRGATRRAFENLIDLCLEEGAAFLLLAGDIFDGNWKDYSTGLFFAAQLARLRMADIAVVLIRGNHDAASQITRHLRLPENVHELSVRAPESFEIAPLGVLVHGQGFATKAVTEDLASGYPAASRGAFNIGLLHTSAGGREGHENYAPCRLETLVDRGYDYWALGHVHQREILARDPYIVFPGNLQGRHVRETGPKGASLVTVEDGRVTHVEHRPLDVIRWDRLEIDVSGSASGYDVVGLARDAIERSLARADGRPLAARVALFGETAAHSLLVSSAEQYASEIRLAATDVGGAGAFVEKILLETRSTIDLVKVREQDDPVGQLARSLQQAKSDPRALTDLLGELADLKQKLPLELREGEGALTLDEAHLREILIEVEQMLIPRLLARELAR